MEQAEDVTASLAPTPVFVDDTGRRRVRTRRVGRILVIGFAAYLGLLVAGIARDPRVGPIHLPSFRLPGLEVAAPPEPAVVGEQAGGTASGGVEIVAGDAAAGPEEAAGRPNRSPGSPGGPAAPAGGTGRRSPAPLTSDPTGVAGPVPPSIPAGRPSGPATTTTSATTTTTSPEAEQPGPGSATTTSTTAPATTTTATAPGQGRVSAKGPDGSGPPGYGSGAPDDDGGSTGPGSTAPGRQQKTTTPTAG